MTRIACAVGLFGGLLMMLHAFVDASWLLVLGLVGVGVLAAALGAELASGSLTWLRALIALIVPVFAACLFAVLRSALPDPAADVVTGLAAFGATVVLWRRAEASAGSRGRHAA